MSSLPIVLENICACGGAVESMEAYEQIFKEYNGVAHISRLDASTNSKKSFLILICIICMQPKSC